MTVPFSGFAETGKTKNVAGYNIDSDVLNGIRQASKRTGVDFGYLMAQAAQESSFQTDARAGTSSATGLYQFLDSTWLSMVREHGGKHGLTQLAQSIQADGRGGFTVADAATKKQILDLRKDPKVSAVIGAEFALGNKEQLEEALGRKVGATELYLAHFLGAGGATRLLKAIDRNASQPAAELLPQAASTNRNVFFDRETGRPRTVGELYKSFSRSIEAKSDQFAGLSGGEGVAGFSARSGSAGFGAAVRSVSASAPTAAPSGASSTSVTDVLGPTLSLMSILELAALDALNPDQQARQGQQQTAADERNTALQRARAAAERLPADRSQEPRFDQTV
jgi:hypothetical protein